MKTIASLTLTLLASAHFVQAASPETAEFFEKKIRPVLIQHCYECHNSLQKKKGGLALDYKAALLAGGDSGEVMVVGKPEESILIQALRHENGYEMPAKAPKLSDEIIRDFEQWVKLGAFDPRLAKPTGKELESAFSWEKLRDERRKWWSFQPLQNHPVPEVSDKQWTENSIDRFIFQHMQQQGLPPQPEAPPAVLVRRVHLILTGLPPTPEVVQAFVADPSPQAYRKLVDDLLASPQFGERWARHWMDWYRFAESHGSEGDPPIPYAQQYRDYLIRALNADVPYNQLLREHLAGDLLKNPRINKELGINESAIGPAHLRMVPHGFGVTDAYGEQITFTDNQIDVISKAMLGVTVSCSRCHNHKFDPISQKDFYRFYGVMISSRPSTVLIDSPAKLDTHKTSLLALKEQIRHDFAEFWLNQLDELPTRLETNNRSFEKLSDITHPLGIWTQLKDLKPDAYPSKIERFLAELKQRKTDRAQAIEAAEYYVDLRQPAHVNQWFASGNGTTATVSPAGSFALLSQGEDAILGVYPAGIYSHLISDKHAAVFSSGNFKARGNRTMVRVAGVNAQIRVPIRGYPLTHGGLHPVTPLNNTPTLTWQATQPKWKYWQGEQIHYELRTSKDIIPRPGNADRSWFGITEIFAGDQPPPPLGASLFSLIEKPNTIQNRSTLLQAYIETLRQVVTHWSEGGMTDAEAEFLDAFVRLGILPHRLAQLPHPLQQKIARYRALENEIPVPTRAPGVLDAEPIAQPLLIRGDYKQESEPVAQQFMEIFSNRPYSPKESGRLQLAEDMVSQANTLKTRVLLNRLWAYVFGQGLAPSTDNLGRLGSQPTHPELLDHLSLDFEQHGWSIKHALRQMVFSRTFRCSSQAPAATLEADAQNQSYSFFTPRRLDAEAIYDSIAHLTGKQERAIYLPVIRNGLNPFLMTFNAPVPTSTVSHRTNTNVPAQTLAMMNGDLVERAAKTWSDRISKDSTLATPADKITAMFQQAFSRSPSKEEMRLLISYMQGDEDGESLINELTTKQSEAQQKWDEAKQQADLWLTPIQMRLQQEVDRRNAAAEERDVQKPIDLKPIAKWDFEGNTRDLVGTMHGVLQGEARVEGGCLMLQGGCMLTTPSEKPLKAKTLEVLVQLDRLDQRGGGAMTVQTLNGNVFDSIVYAEASPATWLAGSNNFVRTIPLEGPPEKNAVEQPVRMVIVYEENGTIRAYRDGQLYAAAYRKSEAQTYSKGQTQVTFGLRHGTKPTGNRVLTGRIYEARLYDRALAAEEVAAASNGLLKETVTQEMLLKAMTDEQKLKWKEHELKLEKLSQAAAALTRQLNDLQTNRRTQNGGYFGIAHILINSKEFLYVH